MAAKKKVTKLTNLSIDEVSLCGRGMNPESNISIYKAKDKKIVDEEEMDDPMMEEDDAADESCCEDKKKKITKKGATNMPELTQEQVQEQINKALGGVDLAELQALALMNDVTKSFYQGLGEEDKKVFLTKSKDEQEKEISKAAEEGETVTLNGQVFRKSAITSEVFSVLKSTADRQEQIEKELKKSKEEAAMEKAKREEAEAVAKAEAEYNDIPGESIKKAKLIMEAQTLSKESKDFLFELLSKSNQAFVDLQKEIGVSDSKGTTENALKKMVDEYAKAHSVSEHQAYVEVLKTDEGKKLYREKK